MLKDDLLSDLPGKYKKCAAILLLGIALFKNPCFAQDVRSLGLKGDGITDDTAALQAALDAGKTDLQFSEGTYVLSTVNLPHDTSLSFGPRAGIKASPIPIVSGISYGDPLKIQALFQAKGDHIRLNGLHFDFAGSSANCIIYAKGVSGVTVSDFYVENSTPRELIPVAERKREGRFKRTKDSPPDECILIAQNAQNVVLEDSGAERITHMLLAEGCSNVSSHGNWMISGNTITTFSYGGQNLRHTDNWSRDCRYQVVWRGGSPDPSRKAPRVPLGSSTVVLRDTKPGDPDWNPHTGGIFDVLVQNNYAEYGNTLAWGNKGRQVIINGNIARFISDYAYGTEGGENVVISNNIAINSTSAGIVSMYWGEKLLISGNMIITRHEPWSAEWSWWGDASKYLGAFVRLHHGPSDPEDKYGAGSAQISGNLFVNELTQRPVACQIENGRDVLINNNKFISGIVQKYEEGGKAGDDIGRITIMDNEFISRLDNETACLQLEGSTGTTIVKDNVLRRETPALTTAEQDKKAESLAVPYIQYADQNAGDQKIASAAIEVMPGLKNLSVIQGNVICGWKQSIQATNPGTGNTSEFVITGNTTDGAVSVSGDPSRTSQQVRDNISIPAN